jgi:uncharacterized protein YacL
LFALTFFFCPFVEGGLMSIEFISRMVGMVVLALVGLTSGIQLAQLANADAMLYATVFTLLGALVGLVVTPWVTIRPVRALRNRIRQMPAQQLVAATFGLTVGLIVALLVSFPLSLLPEPYRYILPLVGAVVFSYLGIVVMVMRQQDILHLFGGRRLFRGSEPPATGGHDERYVLLDTSVIIDGRIADVSQTGFINGVMLVPRFVLNELQHVADSSDMLRRNRGRRGLDILNKLQKDSVTPVRITDKDVEDAREVDDKLIMLAKQLACPILTNDYNLNRVAELQGVPVLNINELANAVKAVFLPGETIQVKIIQEGKEVGQGVGYLDDGTMVVVEDGRRHIGQLLGVVVTKVLQTAAGRMIFAKPESGN